MMLAMEPVTFLKMVFEGGPVVACVALAITVVWTMRKRVKGEVKSQINEISKDRARELQTLKIQTASLTRIEENLKIVGKRVNHHLGTVDNTSVRKAAVRGAVSSGDMKKFVDQIEKDIGGGWIGQCLAALDTDGTLEQAADDILKRLPALEKVIEDLDRYIHDRFELILQNQSHGLNTMTDQFLRTRKAREEAFRCTLAHHNLSAQALKSIQNDTDVTVGMLKQEQRLVDPYEMRAALYAADMRQKLDEFFKAAPNQEMTTNVDLDGAWAEITIKENGFHVDVHIDQDDELPTEGSVPTQQDYADDPTDAACDTSRGLMSGMTEVNIQPVGSYVNNPVSTDPKDTAHFMLTPEQVAANAQNVTEAVINGTPMPIPTYPREFHGDATGILPIELGPEETAEMEAPVFSDDEILIPETELEETELDLGYQGQLLRAVDGAVLGTPVEVHEVMGYVTPEVAKSIADGFDEEAWNTAGDEPTVEDVLAASRHIDHAVDFIGDYDAAGQEPELRISHSIDMTGPETKINTKLELIDDPTCGAGISGRAKSLREVLDAEEARPIESCNFQQFCEKMKARVDVKNQSAFAEASRQVQNATTTQQSVTALTEMIRLLKPKG